jgi:hypothetical protein
MVWPWAPAGSYQAARKRANSARRRARLVNRRAAVNPAARWSIDGIRASATFSPAGGSPSTQNFVWDGDTLLMDSTNAYIYTTRTAPAEQVILATGTITYLNTDAPGSVRGTVNSAGTLTATTSYDAWATPKPPAASAPPPRSATPTPTG